MTLPINPPPLELPGKIAADKDVSGFFDDLLRTVYQLWSEVYGSEYSAKSTSTDASTIALQRVPIEVNRTVYIESRVIARRTGGSSGTSGDSAGYVVSGLFKNIAGTVSVVGSATDFLAEDQAGWSCGYAISGDEVVLGAVGAANNNITWESFLKYYEVGV